MRLLKPLALVTEVAAALAAAFPAMAQTTPDVGDGAATQSIVVTARRVGEKLLDVPLSIRALSGKELQEKSIANISELALFTPGLSYSPDFGRTSERPVIRGISALRPEAPQPVSVFVDGLFMRDGALGLVLDDAQRVEVIKGPQSALYGRSTYAGAINYITVKPGDKLSGTVQVTAASASERTAFGAVTVPLVKDVLSARVRARHYEYGGQYTNSLSGNKIGKEKTDSAGALIVLTPVTGFDATVSLDTSADRDGLFAAVARTVPIQAGGVVTNPNGTTNVANGSDCDGKTINIVGTNPATGLPDAAIAASATNKANGWPCGPATFSGKTVQRNEADLANYTDPSTGISYGDVAGLDRKINRAGLTLNWQNSDGYQLTYQGGYTKQTANLGADQSYNGTRFAPGFGAPASSWLTYDRDKLNYSSSEVRLTSPLGEAFTWLAGAFLYNESTSGMTTGVIAQNAALATIADPMRPKSASRTHNFGLFGRGQYEISKTLRLSVEGRYSEETVSVGGTALGVAKVTVGTCVAGQQCFVNGSRTFKDSSPRISLDYKPNRDMLIYAQSARGSKSGGFNTTPGLTDAVFAFNGETVKALEAGFKSVLAGGDVGLNVALFRNDIDQLQLSNISTVTNPFTGASTTTTIVNNVGQARTQGLELEVNARATPWLTLSGNYAYTSAKALEGTEVTNGTVFGGNRSVAGFTLPRTPTHSAALSAAVDFPLNAGGLSFFGRTDVVYQSRRYAEIQNLIWADAFTHVNASLGVKSKDWRVSLWVKNAGDDATSLNGFRYLDPGTFRRTAVDFLPRLRQYGLTGSFSF